MRHTFLCSAIAISAAAMLACGDPQPPLAPSLASQSNVAGAAFGGHRIKATKPTAVSPVGGVVVNDLNPDLVVRHSSGSFVSGLSFSYVFRVFDEDGRLVYTSDKIPQGSGDTTTHEIDDELDFNEEHTWDVQPFLGSESGPMSDTARFKTMELPDHMRCGPPFNDGAEAIIQCHRDMFPDLHDEEVPIMLKRIARDFNRAGVPGGPFGVLFKLHNNNCFGYSCDVICAGQGDNQNQWDILIDESIAIWGSDIDGIREDVCEIQPSELIEVDFNHPINGPIPFGQ